MDEIKTAVPSIGLDSLPYYIFQRLRYKICIPLCTSIHLHVQFEMKRLAMQTLLDMMCENSIVSCGPQPQHFSRVDSSLETVYAKYFYKAPPSHETALKWRTALQ